MSGMKKVLSVFLVFAVLFGAASFCVKSAKAAGNYRITLDVDFDENMIFSRYDVDVYINSEKVSTQSHGEDFKIEFDAPEGSNTIYFYEHNDRSVGGKIVMSVTGDMLVSCNIHCNSDKIQVKNVSIEQDTTSVPSRSMETAEEPEQQEETAGTSESSPSVPTGDGVYLSFDTATDEELEEAINKIKKEQRARLKTSISFDNYELTISKGKNAKITAEVIEVPEGVSAGKITWTSSDKSIATVTNGQVNAVKNGTVTITASCELSDGTLLEQECKVNVITMISGLTAKTSKYDLGIGETVQTEINVTPKEATNQELSYESSDRSVATVDNNGVITTVGKGTATITASSTDGSNKSVSINVKVTKKDDVGKTKIDKNGVSVTVTGYKESKGSSWNTSDSGNIFLLIDVTIENNSSDEVNMSSLMSIDGYCDGYSSDYSFGAAMAASNTLDGSIAAGKKMKGQAAFEVPKDWKEFELHITPDYWGGDTLEFVIDRK